MDMFKSSNKPVTSKFQCVVMQRVAPGKSSKSSVALVSVDNPRNVAKVTSTSRNLPAPEMASSKQKSHSQRAIKIAIVRPKTVGVSVRNSNSSPRPPTSRSTGSTRSTASSRTQQFFLHLRSSNGVYRRSKHGVFDYHLSPLEETVFDQSTVYPMKSVPAVELQLLRNGQRSTYLERRYERSPDDKYNYPEATSWRYGWFHRESDPFQKRIPRRD
ncbi:uncharacterized protein LOC108022334 [Drosophila biarmipes]|uniref:uncharacterized protein LOC108022334 n=1 Tax=Drosophila biarmipes TaxID=125945 RepID=UPI0007E80F83|nr:uncharacterized protein LOC108022334 [Drosophila biarmipes]